MEQFTVRNRYWFSPLIIVTSLGQPSKLSEKTSQPTGALLTLTHAPRYQVAISYVSEHDDFVSRVARHLKGNGIRSYYAPSEEARTVGHVLYSQLKEIFESESEFSVVFLSQGYLSRNAPRTELEAIQRKAERNQQPPIVYSFDSTNSPFDDTVTVSLVRNRTPEQIANQIANHITTKTKFARYEQLGLSRDQIAIANVVALDHPHPPYSMETVNFDDSERTFRLFFPADLLVEFPELRRQGFSESDEFLDEANSTRNLIEGIPETVHAHHLESARNATARRWIEQMHSESPPFNGRKFGISEARRRRNPSNEHSEIDFVVYRTDYFTHLVMRDFYQRIRDIVPGLRSFSGSNLAPFRYLTTSFGLNVFFVVGYPSAPQLVVTRRSSRAANANHNAGLWHLTMNEGLSWDDRYDSRFSIKSCFWRGAFEELNLPQGDFSVEVDYLEPFVERNNFEVGLLALARTDITMEELARKAKFAKDKFYEYDLESYDGSDTTMTSEVPWLQAIQFNQDRVERFLHNQLDLLTPAAQFSLSVILGRGI